jgi:pimeloyl-ACP methyl ester carboxylesterase
VVVALSHTYASGPVVFPDGRIAPQTQQPSPFDAEKTRALFEVWTADAHFVLAQLRALEAGQPLSLFAGRLDLERMAMFGHSLGGANAAAACQQEPRLRACANLDGSFQGEYARGVQAPFLLMTAGGSLDSSQRTFVQKMSGYHVGLERAGHGTFTDLPQLLSLMKDYSRGVDESTFETGALGTRGVDIIRTYVRAFLEEQLRAQPAPVLSGPSQDFPEVKLTRYPD